MELPVMLHEKNVGKCVLEEDGLYWKLQCQCEVVSDRVERLYVQEKKIGVLEKKGTTLHMSKRISKSSSPEIPPKKGYFTLCPETEEVDEEIPRETENADGEQEQEFWEGEVLGHRLKGKLDGEYVLFPYDESQPCPCEPLLCFFEVKDGFWRLPLMKENEQSGQTVDT